MTQKHQDIYRTLAGVLFASLLISFSATASATSITIPYTVEFSGATPPAGAAPWLTATFDDENTPGTVKLTLAATNLTGSEFVFGAYFNLNKAFDPNTPLSFSSPTKTGSFSDPTISLSTDTFQADGDGRYDILLTFGIAPPANRFGAGDSVEYTITGTGAAAGTLVAADFNWLSAPAGDHGPFVVAAHVLGIGPEGEERGWITSVPFPTPGGDPEIPEPASWLLALGCTWPLHRRRRS